MPEWLNIQAVLNSEFEEHVNPRPPKTLYCSEIGNCLRRIYFNCKEPKEKPTELLKIFKVGNLIHDKITAILRKSFRVDSEQTMVLYIPSIDFRVVGRYDDLIYFEDGKMLLEKKSVRQLDFIQSPHHHHLLQVHLYMKCLGLERAQILYVEKNTFQTKVFNITFQNHIFREAIDRIFKIAHAMKENRIPFPEAKRIGKLRWQCKYCPYEEKCR